MTRKDANQLVKKLLPKYEGQIATPPLGKTISECYDMEHVEPTQEYLDLYEKIKGEVSSYGLKYPSFPRA